MFLTTSMTDIHELPISKRPAQTWRTTLKAIFFCLLFNFGCLMINGSQFVFLLPLRILPFRWSRSLYYTGIRYTKGSFGCLQSMSPLPLELPSIHLNAAVLMCQWFAPTKLLITFETKGEGRFTPEEIQCYSIKNKHGDIVALNFPSKFVLIANHQVCR